MQILVLGMHRSGTSAITRLISMMGANMGSEQILAGPESDNEKGFWERKDVMQLNDRILAIKNATWDNIGTTDFSQISNQEHQVFTKALKHILFKLDGKRPWVTKDPRFCLTLPFWKNYFELPIYLFIYRSPIAVAHSLHHRNNMPFELALALWEAYNLKVLKTVAKDNVIFISFEALMKNPEKITAHLYSQLLKENVSGIRRLNRHEILGFLDNKLVHNKNLVFEDEYLNVAQSQLLQNINDQDFAKIANTKLSKGAATVLTNYNTHYNIMKSYDLEIGRLKSKLSNQNKKSDKKLDKETRLKQEIQNVSNENKLLQIQLDHLNQQKEENVRERDKNKDKEREREQERERERVRVRDKEREVEREKDKEREREIEREIERDIERKKIELNKKAQHDQKIKSLENKLKISETQLIDAQYLISGLQAKNYHLNNEISKTYEKSMQQNHQFETLKENAKHWEKDKDTLTKNISETNKCYQNAQQLIQQQDIEINENRQQLWDLENTTETTNGQMLTLAKNYHHAKTELSSEQKTSKNALSELQSQQQINTTTSQLLNEVFNLTLPYFKSKNWQLNKRFISLINALLKRGQWNNIDDRLTDIKKQWDNPPKNTP